MKVLIVDDSALDRRVAGKIVSRREGFEVVYAEDGEAALASIAENRPDVVLTDLLMPKLTGLQLVEQVRRRWAHLPVILMTAHGSEETAVAALRKGAASYVPKRNLATELVDTLESIAALTPSQRTPADVEDARLALDEAFELDHDPKALARLLTHLERQLAAMAICDETSQIQVAVALREALVNAVYHGNLDLDSSLKEQPGRAWEKAAAERRSIAPYRERRVRVEARHERGTAVTYTITDEGNGFDVASLPDPTDPANLEKAHGRGLMLIRTFMDEVHHNERGNVITMVKRAGSSLSVPPEAC